MTTAIIIATFAASFSSFFLGAYWYFLKFEKRKETGLKDCNNHPLYEGNLITYSYWDKFDPEGFARVTGKIVFENAAFVVKDVEFDGYKWDSFSNRPELLYDWLNDFKCRKVTSNLQPVTCNQL